jgi:hypothetical protein
MGAGKMKTQNLIRLMGMVTCLISAVLIAFGEPIVGFEYAGIATVVSIIGIGLIITGDKTSINGKEEA